MKLYNFNFGPFPQRLNIYLAEKNLPDVKRIILAPLPISLHGRRTRLPRSL